MKCQNCGADNNQNNQYCFNCGQALIENRKPSLNASPSSQNQNGPVQGMRPLFGGSEGSASSSTQKQPENSDINTSGGGNFRKFTPIQQDPVSKRSHEEANHQPPGLTTGSPSQVQSDQFESNAEIRCPSCGAVNEHNSAFCSNCGNSLKSSVTNRGKTNTKICPNCGTENPIHVNYCKNCGNSFLQSHKANLKEKLNLSFNEPVNVLNGVSLWVILSLVGSVLAVISFFLPFQVMKFSNPLAWLGGGPEEISITSSGWQLMTLSSPSVKGLGGLGETAENLYNELDFGSMLMETGDPEITIAVIVLRVLLFLLFIASIAAVVMTILLYKKDDSLLNIAMIILGSAAVIVLIFTSLAMRASFQTGSSDLDLILNSAIKFGNGFGLWGMIFGFIGFGIGGFIRKTKKGEANVI